MTGINLLPWRDERRRQQQRQFGLLTALALVLTAAIMVVVHFEIAGAIEYQNARNQFLQNELAQIEQKIKEIDEMETRKRKLIAKMEVIQRLQTRRPEIVHVFDELARTLPEGVQLTEVTQTEGLLTINGIAQSNGRVSAYMRNIEASPWFEDPVLTVIESKPDAPEKAEVRGSKFTLSVRQTAEQKDPATDHPG